MNKITKTIALFAFVVVAISATTASVLAYQGDPSTQGPNYSTEQHDAMQAAMDNNDYDAWAELMAGHGHVADMVTAENFDRFVEAHNLALAGDLEGAKAIRTELGLGNMDGSGQRQGHGAGNGSGPNANNGNGPNLE